MGVCTEHSRRGLTEDDVTIDCESFVHDAVNWIVRRGRGYRSTVDVTKDTAAENPALSEEPVQRNAFNGECVRELVTESAEGRRRSNPPYIAPVSGCARAQRLATGPTGRCLPRFATSSHLSHCTLLMLLAAGD